MGHLNGAKLPSKVIWERVRKDIIYSSNGYLLFDDSVLDKSGSKKIELARWQYSGTEHDTVMGVENSSSSFEHFRAPNIPCNSEQLRACATSCT